MRESYENLTAGAVAASRANIFARPAESAHQGPAAGEASQNEPHEARRPGRAVAIACLVAAAVATAVALLVSADPHGDARRPQADHLAPPTSTHHASGSQSDVRQPKQRRAVTAHHTRSPRTPTRRARRRLPRPMAARIQPIAPMPPSAQRLTAPAARTPPRSASRPVPVSAHLPAPVAADAPPEFP